MCMTAAGHMKNAKRGPPFFLRRRKCNFEAPGPSPVQFFVFLNIFLKIEIFIIFGCRNQPKDKPVS